MLAQWDEFEQFLRQPNNPDAAIVLSRDGPIISSAGTVRFGATTANYPVVCDQPVLIDFANSLVDASRLSRSLIKRRPNWLRIAKGWLFATASLSARNCRELCECLASRGIERPLILMIGAATRGAGTSRLYNDESVRQIAFDIYPSVDTHFIADAHAIPLATDSMDAVCIQAVLEHVIDPGRVVSEITRILKPDGLVYAEVPFMQQVHEGAYDFTRFSELGHRWLWRDFEAVNRGSLGGPGLSLYWSARYFLRGLTRNKHLGDTLSLPFALAALMDYMIGEKYKIDGANGVYFLGALNGNGIRLDSVVQAYRGAQ